MTNLAVVLNSLIGRAAAGWYWVALIVAGDV